MDSIIKSSMQKALTYPAYRELVKKLSEQNSTTGSEKTEALATYTKLNDKRMKRWDKTLKISETSQQRVSEFDNPVTWLVITESWCGDAAHVLPVLNKMAELNNHIDFKIVLRDENLELMDLFLTNGSKSIPKLIMIDNQTNDVLNTYGPRPSEATSFVNRYKAKYGTLTPEFKEDLQHWYNNDKGQNIIKDITELLCESEPNVCQ
ncbi:thioredoxin family protein [Mariniflexile litorale]|uniref:Thioredoxin family protein n=1 Tax=Mariniflexile litorale TaxID=3045158 RepID=A0AAU7EJ26_9FLAO|nr:thioredoxin family protein [Mariniflexile sp. KMM 9835]MDQ8211020.1 thioredoxin family protein [Mariniflexile sp. KMM 9835]